MRKTRQLRKTNAGRGNLPMIITGGTFRGRMDRPVSNSWPGGFVRAALSREHRAPLQIAMHAQPYTATGTRKRALPLFPSSSSANPADPDRGTRSWTSNRTRYAVLQRPTGIRATARLSLSPSLATWTRCNRQVAVAVTAGYDRSWDWN